MARNKREVRSQTIKYLEKLKSEGTQSKQEKQELDDLIDLLKRDQKLNMIDLALQSGHWVNIVFALIRLIELCKKLFTFFGN